MDIPPNQTLYVNNLPEKIKKEGGFKMLLTYHKRGAVPFPALCSQSVLLVCSPTLASG